MTSLTWTLNSSDLELNIDPSYFTSLALVRKLVLRDQEAASKKGLNLLKLLPNSNLEQDTEEQTEDEVTDQKGTAPAQIPQVNLISYVCITVKLMLILVHKNRLW